MKTLDVFNYPLYWEMTNSEKIALLQLLQEIQPRVAIEIGTKKGGSLQLISAFSSKVYSLDIDPGVADALQNQFPNVEYIVGDSKRTLPSLLDKLFKEGVTPDFILVDGEHSADGVKEDINCIIRSRQLNPMTVLMHDSFNPECRKGMLGADFDRNENIQYVDIDFIQGTYAPSPAARGEMWGGFGLIYFDPSLKGKQLTVTQSNLYSFERLQNLSRHKHFYPDSFRQRIKSYFFRKWYL